MHYMRTISDLEQLRAPTLEVLIVSDDVICSFCAKFVSVAKGHGYREFNSRIAKSIMSLERMKSITFEFEGHQLNNVDDAWLLDHLEKVLKRS